MEHPIGGRVSHTPTPIFPPRPAKALERLQRDTDITAQVFSAVCLEPAPSKSIHLPLVYNTGSSLHER